MTDPALDLGVYLFEQATARSTGLFAYLVAKGGDLPNDPVAATDAVCARWPRLTDEERSIGFMLAANCLRQIAREAAHEADRLDAIAGTHGRG